MKQKLRRNSNSMIGYTILFSAIVLAVVLAFGTYLYYFYHRTIYQDFVDSNAVYLEGIMDRHESDMEMMENVVNQMALEPALTNFLLEEQPVKSMKLQERLYQYDAVSQSFAAVLSFYHEDQYLYHHATSVRIDKFLQKAFLLENTLSEELEDFLYSSSAQFHALPEQALDGYLVFNSLDGMERAVLYFYSVPPDRETTLLFVTSGEYYDEVLGGDEDHNNYLLYNGELLVHRDALDGIEPETVAEALFGMEADSDSERVELAGEQYLLTRSTGESGLTYATIQPLSVFRSKMDTGVWTIVLLLLACSVSAAILITMLSHNMLGRVRKIGALVNEEGYSFDSIEAGVRSLVESRDAQEKQTLSLKRTHFIRTYLQYGFAGREEMLAMAREAQLRADMPFYLVAMMGDRGNSNERKAHELMLSAIRNETLVDGYGIRLTNSNESVYVLFGENRESLDIIVRFFLLIGKDYCEDFVLAVSDYHTDGEEASRAYLESRTAYDYRFLVDTSMVLRYSEVASRTDKSGEISDSYLRQIRNAVRSGDSEEAHRAVAEVCSVLQGNSQSVLNLRLFCNDLLKMLNSGQNLEESRLNEIYNVFTLSQCLTLADFQGILDQLCDDLLQNRSGRTGNETGLADRAVAYMREHYADTELNMASLAEQLNVTPVALAVEFKRDMGISPSDYLAIQRMEAAKSLLRESSLLVREISRRVGYEDDHVFMRRFKKYTGKTPQQYRTEK